MNISAFSATKIGIIGLILDDELTADRAICNYTVSLLEHININAENGEKQIISNIGSLPCAVKVSIVNMYRKVFRRSIYLLWYVPLTNITFRNSRQIMKRQKHI